MVRRPLLKKEIKKLNKAFRQKREIYFVLENIQYARNVASVFRIADALGVKEIILTGISHKPPFGKELQKVSRRKERSVHWRYFKHTAKALNFLQANNIKNIIAIEQTNFAVPYYKFNYPTKYALLVGNEAYGVVKKTIARLNHAVFVPMYGKGASLNVHVSLAIVGFYSVIGSL